MACHSMSRMHSRLTVVVLLVSMSPLLASCAGIGYQPCSDGQQLMTTEHLYFGTRKPDGIVSSEEWSNFLSDTVTPKFPQGFSVWQASGQWKSAAGPIIQESSYVLDIAHEETAASNQAIMEIMNTYKKRFEQDNAVLKPCTLQVRTMSRGVSELTKCEELLVPFADQIQPRAAKTRCVLCAVVGFRL